MPGVMLAFNRPDLVKDRRRHCVHRHVVRRPSMRPLTVLGAAIVALQVLPAPVRSQEDDEPVIDTLTLDELWIRSRRHWQWSERSPLPLH